MRGARFWFFMAVFILEIKCSPTLGEVVTPDSGGVSEAGASIGGFDGAPSGESILVDAALVDAAEIFANCELIPTSLNLSGMCHEPSICGEGGMCAGHYRSDRGACHQRCIPEVCTSPCGENESCMVAVDINNQPILINDQLLGLCTPLSDYGCIQVSECIFECNDAQCVDECISRAKSPFIEAEIRNILECIQLNYDLCETNQCFNLNCGEYWHCMPSSSSYNDPEDCNTTWYCTLLCDSNDADCQTDCLEDTHPEAHEQFTSLLDCATPDFDGNWSRLAERCPEEWAACELPTLGDAPCAEVYHCNADCQDNRCAIDCLLSGSAEAVDQHQALIDCAPDIDPDAAFEACPEAWAACGLDPIVYGESACAEIIPCMDACEDPQDEACFTVCYEGGTRAACDAYGAAVSCIMGADCNPAAQTASALLDASTCEACAAPIQACLGG